MKKDLYYYEIFSRKDGTIKDLEQYQDNLLVFEQSLFPSQAFIDTYEYVTHGIEESWSGAVLAFLGTLPVGVMTYENLQIEKNTYAVGIAYINENNRGRGVWKKMSGLVEKQSKREGAKELKRYISIDVPFLDAHLRMNGYKEASKPDCEPPELVKFL